MGNWERKLCLKFIGIVTVLEIKYLTVINEARRSTNAVTIDSEKFAAKQEPVYLCLCSINFF